LKDRCGAGGTIDAGTLKIQGNHLDRLRTLLGEIGYRIK
jgi:translation initiation factor 1 (eIF-1/SUI1)